MMQSIEYTNKNKFAPRANPLVWVCPFLFYYDYCRAACTRPEVHFKNGSSCFLLVTVRIAYRVWPWQDRHITQLNNIMQDKDTIVRPAYLTPDALKRWIPKLYAANKIYRFYQSPEWKRLRLRVLESNHYECEDCRAQSPTKITRATTVHHDQTVERHPELALSTVWVDGQGHKHQQLFALCEDCHNKRHERFGHNQGKNKTKPITPERW